MNGAPPPLRFERIRSFGRIFGDTRRFIQENFAVFFKTIIFLVGPIALLTCTLQKFYEVSLVGLDPQVDFMDIGSYLAKTQIYFELRWAINGFVTAIVVSHFVKVYREKGRGNFEVGDVTKSIFRDFFGNALSFIILFLGVTFIAVIIFYLVYGLSELAPDTAIALIMVTLLAYFLIRFPVWYFVFSVFMARTSSGIKNVFSGIGLAGKVFAGNWWWTWVLMLCMWLMLFLIGWTSTLSATIVGSAMKLSTYDITENPNWELIESILLSLAEFGKTIINSVFMVTVALHFFSLKEKVDGEGTKKVVEMIGTKNDDEEIELTY